MFILIAMRTVAIATSIQKCKHINYLRIAIRIYPVKPSCKKYANLASILLVAHIIT